MERVHHPIIDDDPVWKKAAFLHERILCRTAGPLGEGTPARMQAEQQADAWERSTLGKTGTLDARLNVIGLDREGLLRHLSGEAHEVGWEDGGAWLGSLGEVLERKHAGERIPSLKSAPGRPLFPGFLCSFLEVGAARLRAGVAAIRARRAVGDRLLEDRAEATLLESLAWKIQSHAIRALTLELNVARVLDKLPPGTSEERFAFFATSYFDDPAALPGMLRKVPVLARLLMVTLDRWCEVTLELLDRLAEDRPLIAARLFGGVELGPLVDVRTGISDLHRGGRSVVQLELADDRKLVYKPKSLAVDLELQRLLTWIERRGLSVSLRTLGEIDRGAYGWVEFVEANGCTRREEVERFYVRQGVYLAVLHALKAVDFHLENLIASGEQPILVDLEALFHHQTPLSLGDTAFDKAVRILNDSVLTTGLLPTLLPGDPEALERSGLGGEAGQVFPQRVATLDEALHDTMRVVRRKVVVPGSNNRPLLDGQPVDPTAFVDCIVRGFREAYDILLGHRDELSAQLHGFAGVEVRQILRPTQRYGFFLSEGNHPDYLRDGLARDRMLDKLWAEVSYRDVLRSVIVYELADLRLGDIPMFSARPEQRHLWSSTGDRIEGFFEQDSLTWAREHLAKMSPDDRALQVSFIRKSLVVLEKGLVDAPSGSRPPCGHEPLPPASPDELLAGAVGIGEQLVSQAIHGREDVAWIGLSLADLERWKWTLSPIQTSLHEGVGGVALFLGYLAEATGREAFRDLARKAITPVLWQLDGSKIADYPGVGAYVGRASHLYVLGHLATLWEDSGLMERALAAVPALAEQIDADDNLDMLSGSAGCAMVLLGLHRLTGEASLLRVVERCGARLLATAAAQGSGVGWKVPVSSLPLGGFSHGVAGIAWALLEIAAATGDDRCRRLAEQGLAYERTSFDPARRNWRDLRLSALDPRSEPSFLTAWCNGASGVALGRILSLPHLDDPEVRAEIAVGVETTLREGFGSSHSLCHGDLGNLDVLLRAGEALGDPGLRTVALSQASRTLVEARQGGFRCGLPKHNETPGVMLGLAGIGLGLLRLWAPERMPSVLALSPPVRRSAPTP